MVGFFFETKSLDRPQKKCDYRDEFGRLEILENKFDVGENVD